MSEDTAQSTRQRFWHESATRRWLGSAGVLGGSLIAALAGFAVLWWAGRKA